MSFKTLLLGIVFIILIGIGGLIYRNAVEHPSEPIACPLDAKVCPDGTTVGRTGTACEFPVCPPPNVVLDPIGIAFAVPAGYTEGRDGGDGTQNLLVAYSPGGINATDTAPRIEIWRYPIDASSTALETIKATAIGGASGAPVPSTAYSSAVIGGHRFTIVSIERFEGVVDTAYYLARTSDVLRFDAIDRGVADWTSPRLDVSTLPAQSALRSMLATLQGE